MATDFLGNELSVGDDVVFVNYNRTSANLERGTITKIFPHQAAVGKKRREEYKFVKLPIALSDPVKHGHWINPTTIGLYAYDIPHCSVCNSVPCGVDSNTRYCPNCGARMDEEGQG